MRSRLVAALAAATLALTACGSSSGSDDAKKSDISSLSAEQIVAKAKKAAVSAKVLRMQGEGTEAGQSFSVDMTYVGEDADGSFSIDGNQLNLRKVGGETFFKADDEFWKAQVGKDADQVIAVINGRWIKTNGEADFADLIGFTDRETLLGDTLKAEGTVKKGKTKTVEGVECLGLDDTEGLLYVALDDARPIKIVPKSSEGGMTFAYDDAEAPKAPAASDVIDSAQFQ